jgi:alkylhydroperoxidase family enzyme
MFQFDRSLLHVKPDLADAFRVVWTQLAAPGTWWTGTERVSLAKVGRAAYAGEEPPSGTGLSKAAVAAATLLGAKPSAITKQAIVDWEQSGLDSNRYVELVGVVSRVTAVDTFHRALGCDLEPLPTPSPGEPTRNLPAIPARTTKAWVPMIGPPSIPISLSAVPTESDGLEALHAAMYLAYEEMGNPVIQRGLSRVQMELVAARASVVNECFF